MTGANGVATLNLPHDALAATAAGSGGGRTGGGRRGLRVRDLNGESPTVLEVTRAQNWTVDRLALLADQLVATRRVRADDLANDLAAPTADSVARLLTGGERASSCSRIWSGALAKRERRGGGGDMHLLDPEALRDGELRIVPIRELPHVDLGPSAADRISTCSPSPGLGWDTLPWALPDDQSYRDYLRSVFVLFAHQQKLGVGADPKTFPDSSNVSSSAASSRTSVPPTEPRCRSIGSWCRSSRRS